MTAPLALTLGEPAGIGPDITLAAWLKRADFALPPFCVVGDAAFLARRAKRLGLDVPVREIDPEETRATFATALPVVALDEADDLAGPGVDEHEVGPGHR